MAARTKGRAVYVVDGARTPFFKATGKPGKFKAGDLEFESAIDPHAQHVSFTAQLEVGTRELVAVFKDGSGHQLGAYYLTVTRLEGNDP